MKNNQNFESNRTITRESTSESAESVQSGSTEMIKEPIRRKSKAKRPRAQTEKPKVHSEKQKSRPQASKLQAKVSKSHAAKPKPQTEKSKSDTKKPKSHAEKPKPPAEPSKPKAKPKLAKAHVKVTHTTIDDDDDDDDDAEAEAGAASEVAALNDDNFFYEQLEKNKPTTESSDLVEQFKDDEQSHINREVDVVHGKNGNKMRMAKRRQKYGKISNDAAAFADINGDSYEDYGEMNMSDASDADVDTNDDAEEIDISKYGFVRPAAMNSPYNLGAARPGLMPFPQLAPLQAARFGMQNPLMMNARLQNQMMFPRRGLVPMNLRPAALINPRPIPPMRPNKLGMIQVYPQKNRPKMVPIDRPVQKQTMEKITITKKLKTPEELHEEIDKIFEAKNENYNKKGHDKSHWELRIMPKTHEEFSSK